MHTRNCQRLKEVYRKTFVYAIVRIRERQSEFLEFTDLQVNAEEWKSTLLGVILRITSFWSGNPLSK